MKDRKTRGARLTQARYDRVSRIYDLMEWWAERTLRKWRQLLWSRVGGGRVLEVGVGTGKNLPYKPSGADYIGVDLSPKMLRRAARRAREIQGTTHLALMDAQSLAFADNSFDHIVATFVFCSVPDPVAGLKELGRVCKGEGRIVLLEHVRSDNPLLGKLMDLLNPMVVRLIGANINRVTVDNVRLAGLEIVDIEELSMDGIVKLITARPGSPLMR